MAAQQPPLLLDLDISDTLASLTPGQLVRLSLATLFKAAFGHTKTLSHMINAMLGNDAAHALVIENIVSVESDVLRSASCVSEVAS